jgi:hypothetical protein
MEDKLQNGLDLISEIRSNKIKLENYFQEVKNVFSTESWIMNIVETLDNHFEIVSAENRFFETFVVSWYLGENVLWFQPSRKERFLVLKRKDDQPGYQFVLIERIFQNWDVIATEKDEVPPKDKIIKSYDRSTKHLLKELIDIYSA